MGVIQGHHPSHPWRLPRRFTRTVVWAGRPWLEQTTPGPWALRAAPIYPVCETAYMVYSARVLVCGTATALTGAPVADAAVGAEGAGGVGLVLGRGLVEPGLARRARLHAAVRAHVTVVAAAADAQDVRRG
jgi:hypothetical protein